MQKPLVEVVHDIVRASVQPGDCVIDATAGNGHDTLMLAEAVAPHGRVHAFDIQADALEQTRLLLSSELQPLVSLHHASHGELSAHLPSSERGQVAAVLFNLGYLPGGDKQLTTRAETTLQALDASLEWLRPGGLLSVLAYIGHPGGIEEANAVLNWFGCQRDLRDFEEHRGSSERSPRLFVAKRI